MIRAGVDEAGLGPALGPLVVGLLATRSPDADLLACLGAAIGGPGTRPPRVEIGDSKKIHTGTRKLARIERTVLATLGWIHGEPPADLPALLKQVCVPTPAPDLDHVAPWYADAPPRSEPLPIAADRDEVQESAALLRKTATERQVVPIDYRADLVSAARFNRELRHEVHRPGGSKNTWATAALLRRVSDLRAREPLADLLACCDRSGGRQSYGEPLTRAFPDHHVEVLAQSPAASRYALTPSDQTSPTRPPLEIRFLTHGDSIDPRISWASCLAKYLRELTMGRLNRYWSDRLPGLRPTAGYPQDARRFLEEIERRSPGREHHLDPEIWIRHK